MRDLAALKAIIVEVLADPSLSPEKDESGAVVKTFCNFASKRIARAMGCEELDDKMADQQYATMSANQTKRWAKVDGMTATAHACAGGLAFAAMNGEKLKAAHGHIAAVSPKPMEFSGSLNKDVPILCNVGKANGEVKSSQCFPVAIGEPEYYIWD